MRKNVSFKHLIMGVVVLLAIIPLNGYAQQTSDELTKEIDFSNKVKKIKQLYNCWCVYACLESLDTNLPQCTHCFNFLHRYYMDGQTNPYQFVDDISFNNAINDLKNNTNKTCDSSATYADFGVTGECFETYLNSEGLSTVSATDFYNKITQKDKEDPSITFFMEREGNTGHCVVFMGSKLYNDDWFDSRSIIYILWILNEEI